MAEKDFNASIKKLNKDLEKELEKKYVKIMGRNARAASEAAKKEVKRITDKIHKKIVSNGNKEIQNIVNIYDEAIKNSRKSIIELSGKLSQIDHNVDRLKASGKVKKDYVNKQSVDIERKLKELQNQILIAERDKQKAVKSYIVNNDNIQSIEKQALEQNLKALTSSKNQRLRILQLQDRIAKANEEKKKKENKKTTFGDFKSSTGKVFTHHGFGFEQERALIKGLFSPITNFFSNRKVDKEDRDKTELALLMDSIKNNSEIYEDVGKKLAMVLPRPVAKQVSYQSVSLSRNNSNIDLNRPMISSEAQTKKNNPASVSPSQIRYSITIPSANQVLREKTPSFNPFTSSEKKPQLNDQLKLTTLSNFYLEKIYKLLLYGSNKTESGSFLDKLFNPLASGIAMLTGAKWIKSLFSGMGKAKPIKYASVMLKKNSRRFVRSAKSVIPVLKFAIPKLKKISAPSFRAVRKSTGAFGSRFLKSAVTRVPIIGGVATAGLNYATNKSVTRAVSSGVGSMAGAAAGGAIGATVGSIVPVIGTWLGGLGGAIVGDIIGSYIGDKFGSKIKNNFVDNPESIPTQTGIGVASSSKSPDSTSVALEQNPAVRLASVQQDEQKNSIANINIWKNFLKEDLVNALASKLADEIKAPSSSSFSLFSGDSHQGAFGGRS